VFNIKVLYTIQSVVGNFKMKLITVTLVFALAVVATYAEINAKDLSAYNYHAKVGIPLAAKIKRTEEDAANAGLAGQRIVGGSLTDISEVPYQVCTGK
jgi:hypothetical protein